MPAGPTQSAVEPVRYWIDLPEGAYGVRAVRGTEGLSRPYRFEVELRLEKEGDSLTADDLSRARVLLGLHRGSAVQRVLRGLVTEIRVGASLESTPEVHLVIEPHLALLRHRTDCRVFRNKTVPQIVDAVLEPFEWRAEWRLENEYAVRPYTVQYEESDLDFVHRLLEDEGIFYFVPDASDLDPDDDNPPVIVCADHAAAYSPIAGGAELPFVAEHGLGTDVERVTVLGPRKAITVGKVSLRDFNPDKPSLDMDVETPGPQPTGVEYYQYPGKYVLPPEGLRKASLMSEAFARATDDVVGRSDCARLRPSGRFELGGAPAPLADGSFVVRSLEHRWNQDDDSFDLGITLMDASLIYRPPRVTPSPRIVNPLTGRVTGPEGEDIHCDSMGRVKVRFFWDRLQPLDDTVSDWIPVLQDNTGTSTAIPRIGWEVLVGFLEGDPDRPVVLGRTYNGDDKFPEPLPEGKTRSSLQSLNSPGRDGYNQVRMDDAAGNELVTFQAERDQQLHVANDKKEQVLNCESHWVAGNESVSVGTNSDLVVAKDAALTIQGNHTASVGASQTRQVTDDESDDVSGSRSVSIGGMHYRRIANYDTVAVGVLCELVGGLCLEVSLDKNHTDASKLQTLTIGGALVELCLKEKKEGAKAKRIETVGGLISTDAGIKITLRAEVSRTSTVAGMMSVTGDDQIVIEGATNVDVKSGTSSDYLAASKLVLKVGGSSVAFEGSNITVKSAGNITIDGGGAASLLGSLGLLNSG